MQYGYDFEADGQLQLVMCGGDKRKAARGAARASVRHGSAAVVIYPENGAEAIGAVYYVDGYISSRDGVTG